MRREALYMLPCIALGNRFIVWMKMERNREKFTVDAFAQRTRAVRLDPSGIHSIAVFHDEGLLYILSTIISRAYEVTLSVFDLSLVDSKYVEEQEIFTYNHIFFNYNRTKDPLDILSIRDMIVQNSTVIYNEGIGQFVTSTNVIMTCYNNGILYFQAVRSDGIISPMNNKSDSKLPEVSLYLTDVDRYFGLGRIFRADDYRLTRTQDVFYITISLPPKVIELNIFYNSPMKRRIYMLHPSLSNIYEGRDLVAANDNYVVTPAFNLREWRLQLLVFYRMETSSRMWHSIISLDDPPHPLTSLHFLCSTYCNTLFSRNVLRSDLNEIQNINLSIDTTKVNHNIFPQILNRDLLVRITITNIQDRRLIERVDFFIKVIDLEDMDTYHIAPFPNEFSYYGYGDPTYFHSVSQYYSGPDLKFALEFENPDINGYLLMPNITRVYEIDGKLRELDVGDICRRSLFHSFVDPFTLEEVITFY